MLYQLTAKQDISSVVIRKEDQGKIKLIPKGYTVQVPSRNTGGPKNEEIRQVLVALGFGPSVANNTGGKWTVKEIK